MDQKMNVRGFLRVPASRELVVSVPYQEGNCTKETGQQERRRVPMGLVESETTREEQHHSTEQSQLATK